MLTPTENFRPEPISHEELTALIDDNLKTLFGIWFACVEPGMLQPHRMTWIAAALRTVTKNLEQAAERLSV